jgi:peptidylprolyl isomerase
MSPTTDLTAEMVQVTQAGAGQAPTMTFPVPSSAQVLSTKDVKVGEGTGAATAGSTVTANYVGMGATTGKVFDSSYSHGGPISFPLSRVIPGWTEGIPGMKVGGERVLVIPGAKAYGPDGQGSDILPNETLVFYVQLTKIS